MAYQPPFSITHDILNRVADISEQVGRLESSGLSRSPQLRKQNRIKTITGTLAIEGNTLTEEQITAIVDGQRVLGSMREISEVKGAIAAYEALPKLHATHVDDLLLAHGLLVSDTLAQAGAFRSQGVAIYKEGMVHHMAPPAHQVSGLIAELMQWLQKTNAHPLIASSVFHYEFEFIHPFTDGNGRMGRLWQTLILSRWHPLFLALPLESVIKDNQQQYYQALEQADEQADSTVFIQFMLKVIADTLRQNAPANAPLNAPVNERSAVVGLKTPDAILVLLTDNPHLTRVQLASIIGRDVRTIARALAKLQQSGKVKRIGSDKAGHWEINLL